MIEPKSTSRKRISVEIVDNADLAPAHTGHFRLTLDSPWLADNSQPGQFIHILPPTTNDMLRRPFSIESVDSSKKHVTIFYRVVGEGTRLLSDASFGDMLDIIGPLGNGFPIELNRPAVLVGGGVGIPPLVYLASVLAKPHVFLGAKNSGELVCVDEFRAMGITPILATEDGSAGFKGFVTEAMDDHGKFDKDSVVYACGPVPMLAAVAQWSKSRDFRCLVSLENKLGCGIGACLGCSIPIRDDSGDVHYERVCYDGPVFDASMVAFDLMKC